MTKHHWPKWPKTLVAALILCSSLGLLSPAGAEPPLISSQLIGGQPANLQSGPTALIIGNRSFCSGILVGPREVLSAGHCLEDPLPPELYGIWLGGRRYTAASVHRDPRFNSRGPLTPANGRFDLGLLILKDPPPQIQPLPVAVGLPVRRGQGIILQGYGLSEDPAAALYPRQSSRAATARVTAVLDGVFRSTFSDSGAAVCSGDSGGPVLRRFGRYHTLVGITSAGMNDTEQGICVLNSPGTSQYVDLQSPYAQAFLAAFPQIHRSDGRLLLLQLQVDRLIVNLRQSLLSGNAAQIHSSLRSVLTRSRRWRHLGDKLREPQIRQIAAQAGAAAAARRHELRPLARRLLLELRRLSATGVY